MARTTLEFGPFTRSVTTVEPHLAPAECIAAGSLNYLVDPVAGGAFKRNGFAIGGGDTVDANKRAVSGITESKPGWVAARLRSFKSDALADGAAGGYPTPSILYRKEASSTSWPTVDDGVFGTEYVRRSAANYVALSEFGSACYPTGGGLMGGTGEVKFKVAPLWYESGEGGYMRGATELTRRFFASGTWSTVEGGRWRYYGNLRGTPLRWDGGCNDSSASVSNSIRVIPTGPLPPAWMPTLTGTTSVAVGSRTTEYPWTDGDAFFYSVVYRFEDGSYSAPVIPRAPNSTLTGGYGWCVVGTAGGTNAYKSVNWTNIPRGPAGTTDRVLLRTRKMSMSAATTLVTVDISDLRVCGVIRNNVQTTYVDTLADDDGLLLDADVVRFDTICPPRSRYLGTGDNRVLAGYTLPNPLAIQLVAAGVAVDYGLNLAEDSTSMTGATSNVYRVRSDGVEVGVAVAGAATSTLVDFATYTTLQAVVDKINTINAASTYGQWRAQLAPGADGTIASDGALARTTITSSSSTSSASNSLVVDSATYNAVPIGYYVYDSAGKVNGLYVIGKLGSNTLQLSGAGSGAGSAAALVFYCDTGDGSCVTTAGSKGWIRAFGPGIPSFVYFKRTALSGYDKPAKDRVYFTAGSPGAAATGVSMAPNLWVASNRRDGVNDSGQVMGIADVQGAAVVLYRKRVALFVNERGSNTGEDYDYRMQTVNDSRGCVSPWSVVAVNGAVVYATNVGLVATDKSRREIGLTADMYQPIRGKGSMSYEFPLCVAAAAADSPDCWMVGTVWGNRLVYSYRTAASDYAFAVYDFSLGVDAQGLESLASPSERRPYGWSAECIFDSTGLAEFGLRAMGAVSASDGLRLYAAINDNSGTTDGRYDQAFTGATDNGDYIAGLLIGKVVVADPKTRLSIQNATVLHKIGYASTGISVTRSTGSQTTYVLASAGSADYAQELVQMTQAARSPGDRCSVFVYDDQTSTGGLVWRVDVEVDVLPKMGD